jgi:hypothetical protein
VDGKVYTLPLLARSIIAEGWYFLIHDFVASQFQKISIPLFRIRAIKGIIPEPNPSVICGLVETSKLWLILEHSREDCVHVAQLEPGIHHRPDFLAGKDLDDFGILLQNL